MIPALHLAALRLAALCLAFLLPAISHAESFAGRDDVAAFVAEMQERHGFAADALNLLFARTRPIPAVLKAIAPPPDPVAVRSWQAYRGRFVEPKRLAAGRLFMRQHAAALARAQAQYGVPAEVIAAIIGVETIYGRNMGRFGTFAALATLAFEWPPRAALFRGELEALLLLARDEGRDPLAYKGSYAGAIGLPQFLPSSIRRYAVDFDRNGRIALSSSPVDAIGSVGNFLREHGWETDGPVAFPVAIAAGGNIQPLLDEGILPRRPPADMAEFGVASADAPAAPAALIDLVTPEVPTEYWLGYKNFWVITRYNRSSFYAMTVFQFAEELKALAAP